MKIGSIVWGVRDIERAVTFWQAALDYELHHPMEDDWASLFPKEGKDGVQLSLMLVTSQKPRRHHIDLFTMDMEEEVERLVSLGATVVEDWDYHGQTGYTVLQDPDGNPFCVCREA